MIIYPNAKINLGLRIISKRTDGFHNIETCFYPVSLCDILEFIETVKKVEFTSSGITIPGEASENICIKAWELLHKEFDIPPVEIHLHKVIPIGAGLGGGSADGAFMLKGLADYFKLDISEERLYELAGKLGSDCAFFLLNSPAIGTGRGEILEPLKLNFEGYKLMLVNPGIHVSTAAAYTGVVPKKPVNSLKEMLSEPITHWGANVSNDFERGVFKAYPGIERVKKKMLDSGAVYAAMSGSGSTVFGIFRDEVPDSLKKEFKDDFLFIEK